MGDKKRRRKSRQSKLYLVAFNKLIAEEKETSLGEQVRKYYNEEMSGLSERWQRRLLRNSLHTRDMCKLKGLIHKGINVNMVISDVFWDTPLIYAVKCGYLELVEVLTTTPGVQIDQTDRNKHSPLDEGVRAWVTGSPSEGKHVHARRYRVVRCLLTAGASRLTPSLLDNLVFSVLNTHAGQQQMGKLAKLICQIGKDAVRGTLLGVLAPHKHTLSLVNLLLSQGTSPEVYVHRENTRQSMHLENAIALVKASNERPLLAKVERDTSHYQSVEEQWTKYRHLLRLLVLSGHSLRLATMNYLFLQHAELYRWVSGYVNSPLSLAQTTRVAIRHSVGPNVLPKIIKLKGLPKDIKLYLLFEKL